jgi:two-component system, NtrC family, response regulator AtoC
MKPPTVLVVDDESLIRWSIKNRLTEAGFQVKEAETAAEALSTAREGVDLVLLDYRLPDADGLSVLKRIKETDPDTVVLMLTGHGSVGIAVEAMKQGAFHYVAKPFDLDELTMLVEKGLETTRLRREVKTLRASRSEPYSLDRIIGDSPAMQQLKALLKKVASSPASTVLLTGESGTGKDLAAKVIHFNSARSSAAFMNITCSALPETLLESELFGHERGAFTDARQQKKGLFELADGGTLFLDEIGEMVPALQSKLLRFLEEKTFKRVGGSTDIRVDLRVIAATNRNLDEEVRKGKFREDLYYRLKVLPLFLPPLRDRSGDIPPLVRYYVDAFNREFKKNVRGVTADAMRYLESHAWPGNIRELRNAIERAMLLSESNELTAADFSVTPGGGPVSQEFKLPPGGIRLDELERSLVEQALARAAGNQTRAATLLGLNRDQVRYRIEKFGLAKAESATTASDKAQS